MQRGTSLKYEQPWIHSPFLDFAVLLAPSFVSAFLVLIFRDTFDHTTGVPLWAWVTFILCIDVAHVYSTVFRTYLSPVDFNEQRLLLTVIPLAAWLVGVLLYSINPMFFWRTIAYVAVFHFIRQQYGFMRLYSRDETPEQKKFVWLDKLLIYLATLYPIIYWHTHLPRNFHWFVDGDFVVALPKVLSPVSLILYSLCTVLYAGKELYFWRKLGHGSIPKQLMIVGTALSWYVGIVALNGDMAFTITNVVSHGLPYMGLVWIYGRKQTNKNPDQPVIAQIKVRNFFSIPFVPVFITMLLLLAFIEEGLWDGLVWRDHASFFSAFSHLPRITDQATLAWLVPLLSLPQVTHYILDGFIWRLRDKNHHWQRVIFPREILAS